MRVDAKVHRAGGEGYFAVTLPLPKDAPADRMSLLAKVQSGDAFLVHAVQQRPDQGTDITLTGRYERPGRATITVLARPVLLWTEEPATLVTVELDLPGQERSDPSVMRAWANDQRRRANILAFTGGDSFPVYWNTAAATRYGLDPQSGGRPAFGRESDAGPPDLYSVFTGAAAIQESLQLEPSGRGSRRAAAGDTADNRPFASLAGPAVRSHPFAEMLKGRRPRVPDLAAYVPEDQYAVFFADINKQIELADLLDEWGGSLIEQFQANARDFGVRKRLVRQLCLETTALTRLFGDRVIGAMAFTGNDPFLKEGTDLTVLFVLKKKDVFLRHLARKYAEAVSGEGAHRADATTEGTTVMSVTTADGSISSHAVVLGDVAAVSNSPGALRRIIGAARGSLPTLAAAKDLHYLRTIFPESDAAEDIFIYLSDAHIRKLVGPRWKIGEARRMRCASNLQFIANARFWYSSERRRVASYDDLQRGGYFGKTSPTCPDSGAYGLAKDGGQAFCSVHNRMSLLTPLVDIRATHATGGEASEYAAFVDNYSRYWSRFFDPIGIRIKLGDTVRIETCILPLIENSWYDGLVAFAGRQAGPVRESLVLPRTIISLRGRMDPAWLQKTELVREFTEQRRLKLGWLGEEISLNLCDGQVLFTVDGRATGLFSSDRGRPSFAPIAVGYLLSALNLPTYLSVSVTDANEAERAIPWVFQSMLLGRGGGGLTAETYTLEPHRGKNVYVLNFTLFMAKLRLYAGVIGDRLVIASRRDIITDLIDVSERPRSFEASLDLSLYRNAFKEMEPVVNLGYQEDLRHACHKNLALIEALLLVGAVPERDLVSAALSLRGYEPYCPSGGSYRLDERFHRAACSVHGSSFRPKQPSHSSDREAAIKLVNSLKRINVRLAFTPEGLMSTVELERSR
jgi:hypothetical protein